MGIRERVAKLVGEMPRAPQFPSQGATLFVDLERRETTTAYTPLGVTRTLLGGRGANMYYLYRLLDESLSPLDPGIPMIFGSGLLTGLVPSAARGNCTSWSPESGVLLDANAGDYFPSFLRMNGFDHVVLYGKAPEWTLIMIREGVVTLRGCDAVRGHGQHRHARGDRARHRRHLGAQPRDGQHHARRRERRAGERRDGGPESDLRARRAGREDGLARPQGHRHHRADERVPDRAALQALQPRHRAEAARHVGGEKRALDAGTPFLYKPSRLLGAMGTKNNQETTWTEALDAEHFDQYRPGMEGCFRCPVNCRPLNDLHKATPDKYDKGDGPEYVTLGKFGPNLGIDSVESVIRLNNICNDLGLDTASTGSALAWAFELYQRGIITTADTGGIELVWGEAATIERLLFMMAAREGFGNVLADSTRAVERGHYPPEALKYRIAVKGLGQSDPHDARILKAFALGLAVATRGMDHLRNRATLEINARINDNPAFKAELYGGPVSAEPTSYADKERAVRACENIYAVGDSVGMCRFTTKLFNSPSLPGIEEFRNQLANVTGLEFTDDELEQCGLNVMGVERLINHRLGVGRKDDTLPDRWFDEPNPAGPYKGEHIDRQEFDAMLSRFYEISRLTSDGVPEESWRKELVGALGA